MSIKKWKEFLKDVPTEAMLAELDRRNKEKSSDISEEALNIMKEIDCALSEFGSYTFKDKGPDEVMYISNIKKRLEKKSIREIASILTEVLDNYNSVYANIKYDHANSVVNCLIDEFNSLPEEEFEELLSYDSRFEY